MSSEGTPKVRQDRPVLADTLVNGRGEGELTARLSTRTLAEELREDAG